MGRRRLWLAAAVGLCAGAAIGACSSDEDMGEDGFGTGDTGSGAGSPNGATGPSSSTGYPTSGAGGGGAEYGDPPLIPGPPDDAGPDAATACADLDPSKPLVLYVSADDSNSMSSPALARELLANGVPPSSIRTYEFLNYYRIAYPAPPTGQLALIPQLEPGAAPGSYDMQLGVRSFDAVKPRRPMTITFVLDTSGSMEGPGIERERTTVKAIAKSLAPGDIVSMVTWNTSNAVILSGHAVTGPDDATLIAKADALAASGGTDLHAGLVAGYQLANEHYGTARLNRVVLISDGGANVGVTDEDLIALHSEDADAEGIYMVGVGTGPAGAYNDLLMDVVTDKGRGAYVYVDEPAEATRMFVDRFDEVMEVAARGVQVELTLPWYFQMKEFYGEEYSTDPTEIEPQHLAPSDAMIFNQVLQACDAGVVNDSDTVKVTARWHAPVTYLPKEVSVEMSLKQMLDGSKQQLKKGKAIVAYAEALKAGTSDALQGALAVVKSTNSDGTEPELTEIEGLLQKHPAF